MKYMILIHPGDAPNSRNPEAWSNLSEEQRQAVLAEYLAIGQDPRVIGGNQLEDPATATTVRVENGSTLTTDGPFAELKEAIGGYFMLEADNLDEAIELAARVPAARMGGAVEVRPIVER